MKKSAKSYIKECYTAINYTMLGSLCRLRDLTEFSTYPAKGKKVNFLSKLKGEVFVIYHDIKEAVEIGTSYPVIPEELLKMINWREVLIFEIFSGLGYTYRPVFTDNIGRKSVISDQLILIGTEYIRRTTTLSIIKGDLEDGLLMKHWNEKKDLEIKN